MQRTRTYECMCLLDNREVRKGWEPLKEATTGLFTKHGAKIVSARRWDERRLAYPVAGQLRGTYLLIYFTADTQTLSMIRRDLEFSESLLRYLLVDCDQVPDSAHEPEAAFDVNSIPADDAPDEPDVPEAPEASSDESPAEESKGDDDGAAVGADNSEDNTESES